MVNAQWSGLYFSLYYLPFSSTSFQTQSISECDKLFQKIISLPPLYLFYLIQSNNILQGAYAPTDKGHRTRQEAQREKKLNYFKYHWTHMSNNPYNRKKRKILEVFSVMKPFVSYTKGKKITTQMWEKLFLRGNMVQTQALPLRAWVNQVPWISVSTSLGRDNYCSLLLQKS